MINKTKVKVNMNQLNMQHETMTMLQPEVQSIGIEYNLLASAPFEEAPMQR